MGFRAASQDAQHSRIVLDFSDKPSYTTTVQADPMRLVVEFAELDWRLASDSLKGAKLVSRVRFEAPNRLILDLSEPALVAKMFLIPPQGDIGWRFVIDLEAVTRDAFLAKAGSPLRTEAKEAPPAPPALAKPPPPPAKTAAAPAKAAPPPAKAQAKTPAAPPAERKLAKKPVIVLDPGHGGVDPGAIGVNGVYEKHITLAMARDLKDRLETTGRYTVALTRDRDVFLRLRDRVAKARAAGADLFISLHADALQNPSIQGLSVYTLSENASDAEAALLADKENKADLIAGIDLSSEAPEVANILIDLAQRETMNLSAVYANHAVEEVGRQIRLLGNTHRFAGFAVLKAPDVPSVLIELGYLSNKEEERLLRTHEYRIKLANGLAKAIDRFFEQSKKPGNP